MKILAVIVCGILIIAAICIVYDFFVFAIKSIVVATVLMVTLSLLK